MSDVEFNCPHCEQSLEIPEDMFGQTVECPSCNGSIQLPEPEPQAEKTPPLQPKYPAPSPSSLPPQKESRDCPFCGEKILAIARKCKHCGEFLDGTRPTQMQSISQSKPYPSTETDKPVCQLCGAGMSETVVSSGNCSGIVVALIAFAIGILITVFLPVVGIIIGPIICFCALFMGGKRQKVWKCTNCASLVDRG
jgi:hypothetical protein